MAIRTRLTGALAALLLLVPVVASAQKAARERSEIDEKYQWNLAATYATDEAWEADLARMRDTVEELKGLRDRLGDLDSGAKVLDLHRTTEAAAQLYEKLLVWAFLKADEDTRISKYQGYTQQIRSLGVEYSSALSWVEPALVAIPQKKMLGWMDKTEGLALYRQHYENLWRQQQYVLSDKEERILSLAGDVTSTAGSVYSQMMSADLSFGTFPDENGEEVEMTQARYITYMRNPNRGVREAAYDVYYDGYEKYINASTETYAGAVKAATFYTQARGYESNLQRALEADNVEKEVFENLIATVSANMEPITRYNEIRMRAMELDTLQHWDSYVSLFPSLDEEIPYEEGQSVILAGLAPLGDEYVSKVREGFGSRWIDVYENAGKQSGAYSWGGYSVPTPYILMNYESKIDDVFTLAHEMGHSMHTVYSTANQPQVYADYTIFVAEVASTLNEALLTDHLLKTTTDRDKRIFLLNQYIDGIRGTVYTQVMFSEFEQRAHALAEAGEPLTVESLNAIYAELLDKYSGNRVHYTDRAAMGWCRIGHFYRPFYVYKYATSYAAATAIARKILDGDEGAREAYLNFLSSGSSAYPLDLLKAAGVDLTSPEPIQATCDLLAELVAELDALMQQT
jgi:oligoendopeptidase F